MSARRLILVSLCGVVSVLAFSSASAVAFETHVALQPIGSGEKGSGAGQLELAGNSGIAVSEAGASKGDIYIADTGNHRVDELEPSGAFMRAWGWGVADGLAKFEVCGPDAFPPTATCQTGISGSGAGEFESPTFVAVDNDPASASFGDVYVGDHGDVLVTKFNAEGALVSTWGDTTPTPNGQLGPFGQPGSNFSEMLGITVDASGDLGVAYDVDTAVKFAQFNQEGVPVSGVKVAGSGTAVNQATGDVYVADTANDRIDETEHDGTFMRAWGWGVADGQAKFETCGPDAFPPTATCQAGISGSGAGQFVTPSFIAVDNSAGPSNGDVYVGDTGNHLVTKFNAEGALVSAWGNTTPKSNGQLGPFGQPGNPASELYGIAVDASGDLGVSYSVNSATRFSQFEQNGNPIPEDAVDSDDLAPEGVAADSEGNLFFDDRGTGRPDVDENASTGRKVGVLSVSEYPTGLAVDPGTGYLYVDTGSNIEQFVFSGLGVVSEQGGTTCTLVNGGSPPPPVEVNCPATKAFGAGDIGAGAGIAVDSSTHDIYVADASTSRIDVFVPAIVPDTATASATEVKGHSATLAGTVDPNGEGAAKCQFVWGTTREFGHIAPCEQAEVEGNNPVAVTAKITELQPDTTYYYRLQATNRNGTNVGTPSADRQFATSGPGLQPGEEESVEESVSDVAATSATLNASIDPDNGPSSPVPGAPTSYYFQYSTASTTGCEAASASCASMPAAPGEALSPSESYLAVSQHVQGLLAGTVYHYRVVAISESAGELITVDGPDQTFTTQLAGGAFALPDDRQWELVSPPDKHGAAIFPLTELGLAEQASVDGDAMTFLTNEPTEGEPPGYSTDEQVFATRGPDGWSSRDISLANERAVGPAVGRGSEYVAFSEDLSHAVVQPHGFFEHLLSHEASEQTPYLATLFLNGDVNDPCVESCYRPLVTGKPGYANVPPGTVFGGNDDVPGNGGEEECLNEHVDLCGPLFSDATPDLSRILLTSTVPLAPGGGSGEFPYEWNEGRLSAGDHMPELRVSTSEDGSWKYFMSESVLASGAVAGQPNMYVSHGGVTGLVAVLSGADAPDWGVS
jgi:hypothetical protein